MSRIQLDMHFNDALFALSDGNPGAINVIMDSLKVAEEVDPEGMGAWGFILNLDMLQIFGARIWVLYKDICTENLVHTIAMVRSVQMGVISAETLNNAINKKGKLDVPRTVELLKKRLPSFKA